MPPVPVDVGCASFWDGGLPENPLSCLLCAYEMGVAEVRVAILSPLSRQAQNTQTLWLDDVVYKACQPEVSVAYDTESGQTLSSVDLRIFR